MKDIMSCDCESCRGRCQFKPGWLVPQEVDDLFNYFGINSIPELLAKGFTIDWWNGDDESILILSPNVVTNVGNIQFPKDPRGTCVFYNQDTGGCDVYPVRPYECKILDHEITSDEGYEIHKYVAEQWRESKVLEEYKDVVQTDIFTPFDAYMSDTQDAASMLGMFMHHLKN